ncbi:hypothetical protein [Vreelandella profundi]|uniref:hypothetical protein n=1 Tax=Vreelandella profundi TaxID=2852117 RepID=UPI001F3DE568|nr:hypothetical protein [Halomonas profundi]
MAIDIDWVRENPEEAAKQLDLYRVAEEMQISMRKKMAAREKALAAHLGRIQSLGSLLVRNLDECGNLEDMCDLIEKWKSVVQEGSKNSLARRDLLQHAEALEEAAKETVPAMHKMANWLIARAAEKRRQAEGGA